MWRRRQRCEELAAAIIRCYIIYVNDMHYTGEAARYCYNVWRWWSCLPLVYVVGARRCGSAGGRNDEDDDMVKEFCD